MRIIISFIVMAVFLVSVLFATPSEEQWQSLTDEALDHYYFGRKEEAVIVAREALKEAEALFGSDDIKVVGAVDNLATYLVATGNIDEADKLYQQAFSMLQKKLAPDDPYLIIFMDYLAVFYDKIGRTEYARKLREGAKKIRFKKSAPDAGLK